ncbi:MAG: phospholipid carrier-dependent glycosyltransferase [Desulfobacca sp.]
MARWQWQPVVLLLLGSSLFFWRLGVPGLMDPDEGRYAEIAREMLASGNFITPQLNFLPYLEKPPLVYWLTALSFSIFGANEWAARLVPALSALGGVGAVYWLANRLWGPNTALLAGLITATSGGYFLLGRILILDMSLTCCLTWGLALAYAAWRNGARHYLCWAYMVLGLGVLVKGPVAVVLPVLIFLTWLVLEGGWRQWRRLWHPGGALLLGLLVLPWYLAVAWQNPEFGRYFFWEEHVQRFLAPRIHAGQPVYYYVGVVLVALLPWSFLLPWVWGASKAAEAASVAAADRRFLLVWFGVIFVFFSLSRAKLFPYLLPGLPPLALLTAQALAGLDPAIQGQCHIWRWTERGWLVVALAGLAALALVALLAPQAWNRIAFLAPYLMAAILVLTVLPLLLRFFRTSPNGLRLSLLSGAIMLNLLLVMGVERVAEQRSPRALAQVIKQHWQADSVLLGYQAYSQAISFYTGQPFYLFGLRGELAWGLDQRPDNPYYFSTVTQVSAFLQEHPVFFVIIDPENFKIFQTIHPYPVQVLARWQKYLLIRNGS